MRKASGMSCPLARGLLVALGLAASLVGPASAQEWSGYVTAPDGVALATDVYLPVGEGPWAVVLTRTPYDKLDPEHYPDWCRTLNQHG